MTIDIPEGYKPPEGYKDGQEFKQLVTMKMNGKKLEICALGDISLKDDEDDYPTAVMKGVKQMKEEEPNDD